MQSAFSKLQVANADVDRADRDRAVLREKVASLYAKIDGLERVRVTLPAKETREVSSSSGSSSSSSSRCSSSSSSSSQAAC